MADKKYLLAQVYCSSEDCGPDVVLVEIDPGLIERLELYSKAVADMSVVPMDASFFDPSGLFFEYPCGDCEQTEALMEKVMALDAEPLIIDEIPQAVFSQAKEKASDHAYDVLTVVVNGRRPDEISWSGLIAGTNIGFDSKPLKLEVLKNALVGLQ